MRLFAEINEFFLAEGDGSILLDFKLLLRLSGDNRFSVTQMCLTALHE